MSTGKIARALPRPRGLDNSIDTEGGRRSGYGEAYVLPFSPRLAADEGMYFVGRNATPGTGVAGHAAPTTHDTEKAYIMLKNGSAAEGGRRAYLDYIKLRCTAAGTGGTLDYATHTIDRDRTYSSGGGDITTMNVSQQSAVNTVLRTAKIGAVVPAQANTAVAKIVAHHALRAAVIAVVGDVAIFNFGGPLVSTSGLQEGTLELEKVYHCPPVILGPGDSYHLVIWSASQSAAKSYECEMGFWER